MRLAPSLERLRALPSRSDQSGQGLVEYALIIAIVSLGAVLALGFLSGKINTLFSKAGSSVDTVAVGAPGGGGSPPPPPGPPPPPPPPPPPTDPVPGAPSVTAVGSDNNNGTAAQNDVIRITYSEPLLPSTLCSAWPSTNSSANLSNMRLILTEEGAPGTDDLVTIGDPNSQCSGGFRFGSIDLQTSTPIGGGGCTDGVETIQFNATIDWNNATNQLSITLGTVASTDSGCSISNHNNSEQVIYTPASGVTDTATPTGNALPTTPVTGASQLVF
jgi:Flp pilus assembly pilin Flp